MPNPEHLEILGQGVEAWNLWRSKHPDTTPDLHEDNLGIGSLMGANLAKAGLAGADLGLANLTRADLREADLTGANLDGTKFKLASLHNHKP